MRKSNELSLKEAIDQLLDTYRIRDRINEVRVKHSWEEFMGPVVAKRTTQIFISNKTLNIKVSSAPLKEELMYQSEKIKTEMNRLLGGEFIAEVSVR